MVKARTRGYQGSLEQMVSIWTKKAKIWKMQRTPWRPSPGDLANYASFIAEKVPGRALILGATPDLRDLLASTGSQVALIDITPDMIVEMAKFLKIAKPEKETHIIGDWCAMQFPKEHFDLVVSDCCWWQLSAANQLRLRDKLAYVLKPKGVVVTRIHFCNTALVGVDPKALIREHLSLLTETKGSRDEIRELLRSHLLDGTTDAYRQCFDTAKAVSAIKQFLLDEVVHESHRILLEELLCSLTDHADWSSQSRAHFLRLLSIRFTIEHEAVANDHPDSAFFPVLKLVKK